MIRSARRRISALAAAICIALSMMRGATAQTVEAFYKGRTITMMVGAAPGGINDISARLVARHLSRFVAGAPSIVVQNNPGGGVAGHRQSPVRHCRHGSNRATD